MSREFPDRRNFLKRASAFAGVATAAAALPFTVSDASALESWLQSQGNPGLTDSRPDEIIASDEAYWSRVRSLYNLQAGVSNLDHGWTNPTPRAALNELIKRAEALEALPAEQLPQQWEKISSTRMRAALAAAMKVAPTELALVRNATEALDTVLLGFPLSRGDEVVCSSHDYYAMLDALEQRRARDGIVLKVVKPPVPAPTMSALESMYAEVIGDRTKLVLLTHPSNLTGQYLPVRRIADRAHQAGAEVIVDGAQSLGLLEDPVMSLGCDYYGASCHKWLGTPVGLGVLWMRPEHITKIWPLIPPMQEEKGMARFEWIGTAPEYVNPAAIPALALHESIGASRKAARLKYLSSHLRDRVSGAMPGARFYSRPEFGGTLTHFEVPGVDPAVIQKRLRDRYAILIQSMGDIRSDPALRAVRVSPNVYTSIIEIDRLVTALANEMPALQTGKPPKR
ncbi:MAG: aminotransferase class V-fold PLP-dependent enzyme [Gemmatimonadales bacterium]